MKLGDRGEGSIHPNGAGWMASRYFHGKRHRKTFATEDEARRQLKAWRKEIEGDRFVGPVKERATVNSLADSMIADLKVRSAKSTASFVSYLKPVRASLGHIRAVDLTTEHVRRFIQEQRDGGMAKATVNRRVAALRQSFRLALKDGLLSHAPHFPMLPESDNVRQGFFERPDFEALIAKLPDPINDIATFAYLTGWRKGEILPLTWERIDRAAMEIRLATSKNGRGRVISYRDDPELAALIERRWKAREFTTRKKQTGISPYVFCWPGSHRNAGKSVKNYDKPWKAARKAANLADSKMHDFRRTAARNLKRAGVDEVVAMKITGHKTRAMFDRYNITSVDDTREALARTAAYRATLPTKRNVEDIAG